ncbi:ACT domain-containing protein [Parvivirga hydrogeniphila]|uniref:ACT domain-containing protein n=1 Tax=Parvivirga hydrogeniphila TaxID=2939460 RepID=UPI002B2790C0|nr:ACT domain-containing protein [Parvivirga hydrogeniphila]
MVEQVSVFLENTTGRLAELTRVLGDAGINMRALMVADTSEFGVVRIICDTPRRAVQLLDDAGFGASLTEVLAVEVPDRPGGLADVLEALQADGINVEYAYCFVEPTGSAAVDILRVDEPERARQALARARIALADRARLYVAD